MKNKVIIRYTTSFLKACAGVCVRVCVCVKCASEPSSLFTSRIWPHLSTHITSPQKTTEIKVKQMILLRWRRSDNTKNQNLWGNALQLPPSLFKVNRSLFHPTPARGFCWEMGGDYGVRWIKGLGFEGQILHASLYRSSLSTRVPGRRGLESGKKAAFTSRPRSVRAA